MSDLNPFAGIIPLPPPKVAVRKTETTEQYRYVRRDRSKCAARVADLRAMHGDGRLQPLDVKAAYYISDRTSESYVFSLKELEGVRWAMLYGLPAPDFRGSMIKRIDAIWQELTSLAFDTIAN
jgi:hypothetical protein